MLVKMMNVLYTVYSGLSAAKYFARRLLEIDGMVDKVKEKRFLEKYIFLSRVLPIVLLLCTLPSVINAVYISFTDEFNRVLFYLDAILYTLIGFVNSLAYSYFYRAIFRKCCKKRRRTSVLL
jgi:hypothetical protein